MHAIGARGHGMGERTTSGFLIFNPPRDAEPSVIGDRPSSRADSVEQDTPTVLTKLQKWADYPSVGAPVAPTKFLPMKTPMSMEIITNWSLPVPPKHSLTVQELLQSEASAGRKVGLIIDLANHECLYQEDLPDDMEYAHIQLIAKVLPPRESIDEVQAVAQDFWGRHPNEYIAIHCAYGFNRTGFVVCSYLCQACGMTVEQALDSFAASRPPGVKHHKFVDALHARYGGGAAANSSAIRCSGSSSLTTSTSTATAAVAGENLASQYDATDEAPASTSSTAATRARANSLLTAQLRAASLDAPSNVAAIAASSSGLYDCSSAQDGQHDGEVCGPSIASSDAHVAPDYSKRQDHHDHHHHHPQREQQRQRQQPSTASNTLSCSSGSASRASSGSLAGGSVTIPNVRRGPSFRSLGSSGQSSGSQRGAVRASFDAWIAGDNLSEKLGVGVGAVGGSGSGSVPRDNDGGLLTSVASYYGEGSTIAAANEGELNLLAQRLDERSLMRRETSLHLAKALHEDFGVSGHTPQDDGPSPLIQALEAEEAAKHSGNGDTQHLEGRERRSASLTHAQARQEDDFNFAALSICDDCQDQLPHSVSERENESRRLSSQVAMNNSKNDQQHPSTSGGVGIVNAPMPTVFEFDCARPFATDATPTHFPGSKEVPETCNTPASDASAGNLELRAPDSGAESSSGKHTVQSARMLRNMSHESDNHSLGFGAREIMVHLKAGSAAMLRVPTSLTELDPADWDDAGTAARCEEHPNEEEGNGDRLTHNEVGRDDVSDGGGEAEGAGDKRQGCIVT